MRMAALATGAGLLSTLAFAAPSLAAAPNAGVSCQSDGKINGRGATFAKQAWNGFSEGYRIDVCGPVAGESAPPEVGTNMVVYNYINAETPPGPPPAVAPYTGSGNGVLSQRCRSDAFGGTDAPYTKAQLGTPDPVSTSTSLQGDKNGTGICDRENGLNAFVGHPLVPPFAPTPGPYPAAADENDQKIMAFPVMGGAVAVGFRLDATAGCPSPPTFLDLTGLQISNIFGGDNDGVPDNWSEYVPGCDKPITRVVRSDSSGTSQIFRNYLKNADPTRLLCNNPAVPTQDTWTELRLLANTIWPEGTGCAAISKNAGNPLVIAKVRDTDGAIGYGDVADWQVTAPAIPLVNVLARTGGIFQPPASGDPTIQASVSNCTFATTSPLPSNGTDNDAVGLSADINRGWASDATQRTPPTSDPTNVGSGYPICGYSWGLVYTGLSDNVGAATAIAGLNDNQRRSMYSFMLYILSPLGQDNLAGRTPGAIQGVNGYAKVPAHFLDKLRRGFKNNY